MFQKLIAKIASKLNELGIPYMVIGGQAVLLYGEPRMTKDIDITLGVGVDELTKIILLAGDLKLRILPERPEEFVNQFMVIPVIDEKSGIKVDFIFSFTFYEKEAISRARKINIEKISVNFASLEDIIIHKIFAGRARDLEDVRIILLKNPNYNKGYILKWLAEFDKSLGEEYIGRFEGILKELK